MMEEIQYHGICSPYKKKSYIMDNSSANVHPVAQSFSKRVTALRRQNKMTLEQLALASGVSRSMLSQIERGQANPTLAVSFKIAEGFGIPIGELLEASWSAPDIEVVHGDDPKSIFRSDEGCQVRTLSPLRMEKSIEFYEITLEPGAALESTAHFQGTRELLTVTTGEVSVSAGGSRRALHAGDSAHYRADVDHVIANAGKKRAVCYLVVTYQ